MEYSRFQELFDRLNADNKEIVQELLKDMEHTECKKKVDYSYGLNKEKILSDGPLSWNDIVVETNKKLKEKGLEDMELTKDTLKNIVKRGSSGSIYFETILEVLDVSKELLIWDFWSQQPEINNLKWCYESISPVNQYAVFYLVIRLIWAQEGRKDQKKESQNIGENRDYDEYAEFELELLSYSENFKDKSGKVSEEFSKSRKIPRYKRKEE
ncbi:MAG: hypothetical protein SPL91_03250 [Oliverpabstia intestinalis]|nr:hypothetical protein [Oliverpabstia intestinalis]MDY5790512.1 hypothetical protein [Oliverpabstia intestinalis]